MNNNWFNQQNKHHFALYQVEDITNKRDVHMTWLEPLLSQRSDRLNRRVSRISPRRGKERTEVLLSSIEADIDIELDLADLEELDDLIDGTL